MVVARVVGGALLLFEEDLQLVKPNVAVLPQLEVLRSFARLVCDVGLQQCAHWSGLFSASRDQRDVARRREHKLQAPVHAPVFGIEARRVALALGHAWRHDSQLDAAAPGLVHQIREVRRQLSLGGDRPVDE